MVSGKNVMIHVWCIFWNVSVNLGDYISNIITHSKCFLYNTHFFLLCYVLMFDNIDCNVLLSMFSMFNHNDRNVLLSMFSMFNNNNRNVLLSIFSMFNNNNRNVLLSIFSMFTI